MEKVRRSKLSDEVLKKLRKAILLGEIKRDEHLAEPILAEQFGTSRGPIRDALQVLLREGFVTRFPNGRVIVKGISEKEITDVYDVRYLLEDYAMRQWLEKSTMVSLEPVKFYIEKMNGRLVSSQEFSDLDMKYHEQIVRLADNQTLLQSWMGLKEVIHSILEITNQGYARSEFIIEVHGKIYDELQARNIEKASSLLKVHLQEGVNVMCNKIAQLKS